MLQNLGPMLSQTATLILHSPTQDIDANPSISVTQPTIPGQLLQITQSLKLPSNTPHDSQVKAT